MLKSEVAIDSKLFLCKQVHLPGEPSLIMAVLWILWVTLTFVYCLLAVGPETDAKDKVVPPLLAEEMGHAFYHGL